MTGDPLERRRRMAADAAASLVEQLDGLLGERLRPTAPRPRDGAGWVDVSAHDMAVRCPARWTVPSDDFVISSATVAGAVARLALRGRADGEPVGVAVVRVLAGIGEPDPSAAWFADWYLGELDRAGRASVVAAATTWAVGALSAARGARLSWSPNRHKVDVADRMIQLRANWDAATPGARPDALLVMSGRAPGDPSVELIAGFDALVDGMLRRLVPARVRIGSAATASTRRVVVTPELLGRVVGRIVELVRWRVEPSTAPTVPGRWCADCPQLEVCPDAERRDPDGVAAP